MSDHNFLIGFTLLALIIIGLGAFALYSQSLRMTPRDKMDRAMERARRSVSERELDERRRLSKAGFYLDENGLTTCAGCGGNCGQCGDEEDHGLTLEEYRQRYWT